MTGTSPATSTAATGSSQASSEGTSDPPTPPVIYDDEFPELPFDSKFVEVGGSRMHYHEAGDPDGPVILLTHGWPAWSYIWRDVIPHLENSGRVIAVDLIGFGMSDKLESNDYSFSVQQEFFAGFVEALDLQDLVLVLHDWGSGVGFDYAATHENEIRGVVFFEAMLPPRLPFASVEDGFPGNPQGAMVFEAWRTPGLGEDLLLNQAQATEAFIPQFQLRQLTDAERSAYRAPWPDPQSRWPLWWVPNELPVAGNPANVEQVLLRYIEWLQTTATPMLEFHATPGLTGQADVVAWTTSNIENLTVVDLGEGIHFLQEDHPEEIGQGIATWLAALPE